MERTSLCAACAYFELSPAALAVDPSCQSEKEADALCVVHRARMSEGYCVLCGRRGPWMSPWPGSEIGACRTCLESLIGEEAAAPVIAERTIIKLR